jgi:hypothetical protein
MKKRVRESQLMEAVEIKAQFSPGTRAYCPCNPLQVNPPPRCGNNASYNIIRKLG